MLCKARGQRHYATPTKEDGGAHPAWMIAHRFCRRAAATTAMWKRGPSLAACPPSHKKRGVSRPVSARITQNGPAGCTAALGKAEARVNAGLAGRLTMRWSQ